MFENKDNHGEVKKYMEGQNDVGNGIKSCQKCCGPDPGCIYYLDTLGL
jgi:hypothetical protein